MISKIAKVTFNLNGTEYHIARRFSPDEVELGQGELDALSMISLSKILGTFVFGKCKVVWENEVISNE